MKCPKCGQELPDSAKFCRMCGAPTQPVPTSQEEHTMVADNDLSDDSRNGFQNDYRDDSRNSFRDGFQGGFREAPNNFNAYKNDRSPGGYANTYPNNYPNDGYTDRRYNDPRQPYNGGPVYNGPYGNNRGQKPPANNLKTVLIISIAAVVLALVIAGGVIFFVTRNNVSPEELQEAKNNYLPPAQVVTIDTSKDDPSNDDIQFKFDSSNRISSCSYTVDGKTYDQSYSYNDKKRLIKIDTKYRNNTIITKEIEYDRVSEANVFEVIDDYYVRMDETSLNKESSSSSDAPDEMTGSDSSGSKAPQSEPDNSNDNTSSSPKTLESYQQLYLDFLNSTSISYNYGTLIYLNDDNTPELILWSSGSEVPYYICYIKGEKVQTYETHNSHSLEYSERRGYFTSGTYDQHGYIYYFDGSSVSQEHTFYFYYGNDEFYIDQDKLTQEEYFEIIDTKYLTKDTKKDASNDPHDKSKLPDYIRDFE